MFLKITVNEPRSLPRVRDESFSLAGSVLPKLTLLFWYLRMFERGECTFNDMFNGITATYESNIVFPLRFMIDTKVGAHAVHHVEITLNSHHSGRWHELD